MADAIIDLLASPRCDGTLVETSEGALWCEASKVSYPRLDGMPWLFSDPDASRGEWQNRLHFAIQKVAHDVQRLESQEKQKDLRALTRRRLERHRKCLDSHRRKLSKLLAPLEVSAQTANYESYLALRTRLPVDQGLNTYYANIHRDWAWGDEENEASLKQIRAVVNDSATLGDVLILS